jgi:GntR family transcriptional regulator/MocR family aminotransferase
MRAQALPTFPITVTRDSGRPLPEQIALQVGAALERGQLVGDGRLPSTRTLAEFLGVSRGVTAAAYDLLCTRGYLESRPGSGAYARRDAAAPGARVEPGGPEPVDLRPGAANAELFPVAAWRAAWRDVTFRPPPADPPPALGLPELRAAVTEHLVGVQGLRLLDRTVLITAGPAHGLRVVLDVLGLRAGQVALAEPAPAALLRAAAALPVDAEGACLDAAPAACRALVVDADAWSPLSRLLTERRRAQGACWARRTGGHVIDVAADTGLSEPARRLPRLLDVLGDSGILLGGFGDVWGAALELGFAIVPRHLAGPAGRRLAERGEQPSYLAQRALTTLLRGGAVDRLARRLERLAAQRSRFVESALGGLRGVRYDGHLAAGSAVLHLPPHLDAATVAGDLLTRGVRLDTSAAWYFSRRPVPPALVLGYLRPTDAELRRALGTLHTVLRA